MPPERDETTTPVRLALLEVATQDLKGALSEFRTEIRAEVEDLQAQNRKMVSVLVGAVITTAISAIMLAANVAVILTTRR